MDEKEIRKRLAGRAAEYMMFRDDEENAETTAEISSPSNVIVFPDFEKLKSEVEKMRTELSMLLLERDELQFVICKNIETEYMLKLGSIEYKAYEAQCAALRLKRKIELIQAKKNRQEKVIISAIEETLDNEFAEYQKQLNEQIDKMNDALKRSKAEVLSDEDNNGGLSPSYVNTIRIIMLSAVQFGVSQTVLATKVGMSRQMISLIERGKQPMTWTQFLAIVFFFKSNNNFKKGARAIASCFLLAPQEVKEQYKQMIIQASEKL